MEKKNYPLIDILKFLSAITIIAIHTAPFDGHTDSFLYAPYTFLKCFALPFFFVSSTALFFSKIDIFDVGSKKSLAYLKKWFVRLIELFAVYSVINILLMLPGIADTNIRYWLAFIFLGKNNPYLWFFAAMLEAVLLIYFILWLVQKISKSKAASLVSVTILFAVSLVLMVMLQFYYGFFENTAVKPFVDGYYLVFEDVRNVISGVYYSLLGLFAVLIGRHYNAVANRILLVASFVLAYLEFMMSWGSGMWKEEYSTFGLSLFLVILMAECFHVSFPFKPGLYFRKTSNVIYFQHRFAIIFLDVMLKLTHLWIFDDHILRFFLVTVIMCAASAVYQLLEKTKLKCVMKYLY